MVRWVRKDKFCIYSKIYWVILKDPRLFFLGGFTQPTFSLRKILVALISHSITITNKNLSQPHFRTFFPPICFLLLFFLLVLTFSLSFHLASLFLIFRSWMNIYIILIHHRILMFGLRNSWANDLIYVQFFIWRLSHQYLCLVPPSLFAVFPGFLWKNSFYLIYLISRFHFLVTHF